MAEEIAIINGGDTSLKPTAATRTSHCAQHEDSGGGGEHATPTNAMPIPNKRHNKNNMNNNNMNNNDAELQNKNKTNSTNGKLSATSIKRTNNSDTEDGFLSTSPDSANGEAANAASEATATPQPLPICLCTNAANCVTLKNILDSFKAPLSEEQAWALIFQLVKLYRVAALASNQEAASDKCRIFTELEIPDSLDNLNIHRDGTVHCSWSETELKEKEQKLRAEQEAQRQQHGDDLDDDVDEGGDDNHALVIASQKKILRKLGVIIYTALDYNLQADEQCQMSQELEELITYMTADESDDDCIDEGIDEGYKRWDDDNDDDKFNQTKELDYVLEACKSHVKPTVPDDHYKAVCRALVTETIELRIFLQQVLNDDTDNLRLKADSQTSKQELAKLGFNDWARFWVQVIEELRRGVRLKKNDYSRAPIEYEMTPYEILMEDIRSKKYQLRKVMVNGDIPPRVKKDAHALILEFIRSRPPLKKASERKLPPPIKRTPSPREQLMDSIRKGRTLKHIQPPPQPRLKDRLLPPTTTTTAAATTITSSATAASTGARHTLDSLKQQQAQQIFEAHTTPRSKQRLIKVDFSLLQDDDIFFDESLATNTNNMTTSTTSIGVCSQPKMPPYPIGGYMVNAPPTAAPTATTTAPSAQLPATLTTRVLRRTTYDLATQCESRRASLRRHTIVGCQSNFDETHSMPASRPDSRQSDVHASANMEGGGAAKLAATTKTQQSNYKTQQQQQQQLHQPKQPTTKRSQSPTGSSLSVSTDVGGSGAGVGGTSSNCSRSSSSLGPWNKSFLDEKTWHERGDDRLSLTLEEIVHIRSVMTKAELEGLPVGVRVKEDVEKRKVCFLCLRTRFSIFGPWGIQCKLCQRTVCSKCYTKMRIPVEHFRNVPLVLISPSLLASPAGSNTPSPSHHAHHAHSSSTGNILDETFPKSLIERLLRSESERKTRNTVGSAPSSPKHQRSNMSTPGIVASSAAGQAVEAIHDASMMMSSSSAAAATQNGAAVVAAGSSNAVINGGYNKENNSQQNGTTSTTAATNKHISIMSRSMEGPRSLPVHSPARPYSNSSTLDRKQSKFARAFTLSSSSGPQLSMEQKENVRGEIVPVCHDCKGLVMEITRSSKQTRSSARNRALQNLTLDLSPVYK